MEPGTPITQAPSPSSAMHRVPRRILLFAVLAAILLVASIAALPMIVPASWSVLTHVECAPGTTVATLDLWTPVVLVNSPFGGFGNGTGTYPTSSGWWGMNFTVVNGGAAATFELNAWSVGPSVPVLVAGPGANAICSGYLGTYQEGGGYTGAALLQPESAMSDVGEDVSFSYGDHASVLFNNGFSEREFSVSTCLGGPVMLATRASSLLVQVPFMLNGANHTASARIQADFNYTYSFPGNFGTWWIDDLDTGANAPGGGWAFSFEPCL